MKRYLGIFLTCVGISILVCYIIFELTNILMDTKWKLILIFFGSITLVLGAYFGTNNSTKERRNKRMKQAIFSVFIIYLIFLLSLTLFDPAFGRGGFKNMNYSFVSIENYLKTSSNFKPFKTILNYYYSYQIGTTSLSTFIINNVGNVVVFMPFGIFIRLLYPKVKFIKFFFLMLGASITIELLQMITQSGSCDIDDVILNVLGALLAYIILKIPFILKKLNQLFKLKGESI